MKPFPWVFVVQLATAAAIVSAQAGTPVFKLGTFEREGQVFVGIVLRDSLVIDLPRADRSLVDPASKVAVPADMKDLIARYDSGVRARIVEIVRHVEGPPAAGRPDYVFEVEAVRTLPPVMYPTTLLNTALNYREHAEEMGAPVAGASAAGAAPPGAQGQPGFWERLPGDARWNPYMFLKAPATIIAAGQAIRLPVDRPQIDWECELGTVIGRRASRVPIDRAIDYIFGYTIELDVSDRGGRGDARYGSDWLIHKSQDTFAPIGPFIVPTEFVRDPQKLAIRYTLNGELMQSASSSQMIHGVSEQVSYASHIITLRPGDIIATGSPGGTGVSKKPQVFLKAGDVSACTYEGVGTLVNPVVSAANAQ